MLVNNFSQACKDFGLIISLKKTNVLRQGTLAPSAIALDNYNLDVVKEFTYLSSIMTAHSPLDSDINKRIRKAATTIPI